MFSLGNSFKHLPIDAVKSKEPIYWRLLSMIQPGAVDEGSTWGCI